MTTATTAPINESITKHHLELVLQSFNGRGFLELRAMRRAKGNKFDGLPGGEHFLPATGNDADIQSAINWAKTYYETHGAEIFLSYNPRKTPTSGKNSVEEVTAVCIDIDVKKHGKTFDEAREAIEYAPVAANLVINSGGGYHLIYFIEPTKDKDYWTQVQRTLYAYFEPYGAKDNALAGNEAQLLRLAPFANRKDGNEIPVTIEHAMPPNVQRTTLDTIGQRFGAGAPSVNGNGASDGAIIAQTKYDSATVDKVVSSNRNVELTKAAGFMRGKGFPEPAIAAALQVLNNIYCVPPLPASEVAEIARKIAKYPPDQQLMMATDDPNSPDFKQLCSLREFMDREFEPEEEIFHHTYRGEFLLVQATTNIGKSTMFLNAALSICAGLPFAPIVNSTIPRKVLVLDFENRTWRFQSDLITMLQNISPEFQEMVKDNFYQGVDLQVQGQQFDLSQDSHIALVSRFCAEKEIDVVILDTYAAGTSLVNENDNAEANRVMRRLQGMMKSLPRKPLIVLVHHVGKTNEGGGGDRAYRSRGATAISGFCRTILDLDRDPRQDDCVILRCAKIKGDPFDDTVMRLDRVRRWFEKTDTMVMSEGTAFNTILKLVGGLVRAAGGEAVRKGVIMQTLEDNKTPMDERTLQRRLTEARDRGLVFSPRKGYYMLTDKALMMDESEITELVSADVIEASIKCIKCGTEYVENPQGGPPVPDCDCESLRVVGGEVAHGDAAESQDYARNADSSADEAEDEDEEIM